MDTDCHTVKIICVYLPLAESLLEYTLRYLMFNAEVAQLAG